jgi:hypothetical protein
VLVLLVGLFPTGRRRFRERGLHARGQGERLRASLRLLRADLRDFGVEAPAALTWDELVVIIEEETGLDARPVADGGQRVIFGGREALPELVAEAEALRKRVQRRLRRIKGWSWTLLAWYGLAGLARSGKGRGRAKRSQWWRSKPVTAGR